MFFSLDITWVGILMCVSFSILKFIIWDDELSSMEGKFSFIAFL